MPSPRSFAASLLLTAACAHGRPASRCGNFDWLVGTWASDDGNVESWRRASATTLEGSNTTRRDGEVVFVESLRIQPGAAGFEYRAAPQGQPAHVFQLEACGETWAKFTDPTHDWPHALTYRRTGVGLTATVEGYEDGAPRTETWSWASQ